VKAVCSPDLVLRINKTPDEVSHQMNGITINADSFVSAANCVVGTAQFLVHLLVKMMRGAQCSLPESSKRPVCWLA
jgi:hypothetical protein